MATFTVPRAQNIVQISTDGEQSRLLPAVPSTPIVEATAKSEHAKLRYSLVAYGLVIGGALLGWLLDVSFHPATPEVVQGLGVFAALYVAAQAIERAIEPITEWTGTLLGGVTPPTEDAARNGTEDAARSGRDVNANEGKISKADLKYRRAMAINAVQSKAATSPEDRNATQKAANVAAKAQAAVEQDRRNSTVLIWGIASFLGIIVSGWIGLALLHSVGVHGAPRMLDIIVTGLAIGGGSKPLHDLISNLQASKDEKKDPAEVKSA